MKRIIIFLLIICMSALMFSCTEVSDTTETDTEYVTDETDETEETTDADTVTDGETDTGAETDTETEAEDDRKTEDVIYEVYYPMLAKYDHKGSLTLSGGSYVTEVNYSDNSAGYNVNYALTEKGRYKADEAEIEFEASYFSIKLSFDGNSDKTSYLENIKNDYLSENLNGAAYEVLKKAANGEFSGDKADFENSGLFGIAENDGISKAVLDKDEKKLYYFIPGANEGENEYYITDNGYTLTLKDDGSCRMYCESLIENEKGYGTCIVSDIYTGTYTLSGDQVSCVITKNTVKHSYTSEESERAYKEYYDQQYDQGFLGKVYYDYYMALISDAGYTDGEISDTYLITLEEHTHTARIVESLVSEI